MPKDQSRGTTSLRRRPTLQDVAAAANVSVMTVSRAMRGNANVSQRTRERILAEAERIGYRGSLSARSLRTGESRLIAIMSPNLMAGLHIEAIQGARDAAAQHDYRLILQVDSRIDQPGFAFPADGDLVLGESRKVTGDRQRMVSLVESASDEIDLCGTDLPAVTRDTFTYLTAMGYERIAFLQARNNSPLRGWREAMEQRGIPLDPTLIQEVDNGADAIVEGVRRLTARNPRPDAIVVVHTQGTPIVLDELIREGFTIGRDIGFVGSEVSNNVWGKVVTPGLSMIRIPGYAIGWTGCQRLIARLQGDDAPPQRIILPSELVIRQSTPGRLVTP